MLRKLVLVCTGEIYSQAVEAAESAKVWLDEYGSVSPGYRKVLDYYGPGTHFLIVPYDDREFDRDDILFAIQWELKDLAPGKLNHLRVHRNWVYMPDALDEEIVEPLWEECEYYRGFETRLRTSDRISAAQAEELAVRHLALEQKMDAFLGFSQERISGLILDLGAKTGGYMPRLLGDNPLMGTAALEAVLDLVKQAESEN